MTVIDQILNEWSFRCHDGIVDMNDSKKTAILNEILGEYNVDLNLIDEVEEETSNEVIDSDANTFENFVLNKYAVEGQRIGGLQNLYDKINSFNNSEKVNLFNIIKDNKGKSLISSNVSLSNIDRKLFSFIMQFVKIPNGEPSELWFAILYKGKVEGGVKDKDKNIQNIVSDVNVNGTKVSLKNYSKLSTLDFGSLPSDELKELKILFNLFSIITDIKLNPTLTTASINELFKQISSKEFLETFDEFIKVVVKHPNIPILQRIYSRVEPLLKQSKPDIENSNDVKEIVNNFIKNINTLITAKVGKVNWWGVIQKNETEIQNLYLLSSDEVMNKLISTKGQLNSNIKSFKGNNLFVKGNILFSSKEDIEEDYEEE